MSVASGTTETLASMAAAEPASAVRSGELSARGLYRLGGISFVVSGILFLLKYVLETVVGPPPGGPEILAWRASGELPIALTNEVLFFAAMFQVPAVFALYHSLASSDRTKAAVGCGIIAVVVPILGLLDIVHGRLVYPIYGMRADTAAVAAFVVAVYFGGLHFVGLLLSVATVVLAVAMRHGVLGRTVLYLGIATALFDFLGAYPEAIGPLLMLVSQVLFAVWFVAVGVKLFRMPTLVARPIV